MNEVFLGLGGNIGQRQETLQAAIKAIGEKIGTVVGQSSVYETEAWGIESQHLYLNQVIKLKTDLSPKQTLDEIGRIETQLGRKRTAEKNADRIIDIDMLFYNNIIADGYDMQVPHPRLHLRKFVLIPLCEIDGEFIHPVFKMSLSSLLLACKDDLVVKKYDTV